MKGIRVSLVAMLLSTALLLFVFFVTAGLSAPVAFLYRNAPALSTAITVGQMAAGLAGICVFVGAAILAVSTALQPSGWARKWLYVLPALSLGFLLVGVILYLMGVGTGSIFTPAWLVLGILFSTVTVAIAAARTNLGARATRAAMLMLGAAIIPSAIAWAAVAWSIFTVMTSQPTLPLFRGPEIPEGQRVEGPLPGPGAFEPRPPREPGRFGGPMVAVSALQIGGGVMTVLLLAAGISAVSGWRAWRGATFTTSGAAPLPYRQEGMRALGSGAILALAGFVVMQLIPVPHDNPPVVTTVQWDSPQTQDLAVRACMDCHSNETQWPWYSMVAPASWLVTLNVNEGRQALNLSELNRVPSFRRSRLIEEMAEQIRNATMPPRDYLLLHPEAQLSQTEKEQLIQGLQKSLGATP